MARPIETIALAATAAVLVALAFAEVRTACEAAENANNSPPAIAQPERGKEIAPERAGAPTAARTWQRWEHALTSTRRCSNPYADLTLRVRYTGPGGRTLRAYGFWDGGDTFRIHCAFPAPGIWQWETECSDAANTGLDRQRGSVEVAPYEGGNPLCRRGFLKVSDKACLFARSIVARLFGDFVIFSPSFDSKFMPLWTLRACRPDTTTATASGAPTTRSSGGAWSRRMSWCATNRRT